jgi:hypothetical protein
MGRIENTRSAIKHLEEMLRACPHKDWVRLNLDSRMLLRIRGTLRRNKTAVNVLYILCILNRACSLVEINQSRFGTISSGNVILDEFQMLFRRHSRTVNEPASVPLQLCHHFETSFRNSNNIISV